MSNRTSPPPSRPARAWSLLGNGQRLDGGAMFGNVPRALWARWIAPDDQHRIPLACRCLLVEEEGGRRVLFETGIGAFFPPKLRDRFGVTDAEHVLLGSLAALGLTDADVDVVVLSHLHFDHAGGLLTAWSPDAEPALLFPNARFVVGREAWERALDPHPRDRASFIPELPALLEASGRLDVVDRATSDVLGPDYRFHTSSGHTPGLLLGEVASDDGPIVFAADLIPGVPWVHLPVTMGYDRYPERLIDEKAALLADLVARGGRLFFTHDPETAMGRVTEDHGRYGVGETAARVEALPL
ncbi:MAG: MBL fold metallo-hydrolase [Deltaproteobacteria bacterium]|nr:MBL fold metallo-hydrolase [Deltaproteobacteria bacterium]